MACPRFIFAPSDARAVVGRALFILTCINADLSARHDVDGGWDSCRQGGFMRRVLFLLALHAFSIGLLAAAYLPLTQVDATTTVHLASLR